MSDKTQCHVCKTYSVIKQHMFSECRHMYCIQCLYRLIIVNHINEIDKSEVIRIRCRNCDKGGYLDMTLGQISDFLREKINDDRRGRQNCEQHPEEELNFFCKTCQMNICKECRIDHSQHEMIECAIYAKKYRQYLSNLPLTYKSLEDFVEKFDKKANEFKNEIEEDFTQTITNIDDLIKNLVRLKKEYAEVIKKKLEKGLLILKIIKIFYSNFYLDLQKKDTCTDIFLLKYLKDINFEFKDFTLSHNQDVLNGIQSILKEKSETLTKSKDDLLNITCSFTEIARSFQNVGKLSKHKKAVTSIIRLKDGRLLTGSRDYTIRFWEERDGTFVNTETINEFTGCVQYLFQCEDGQILSSCQDNNTIRIWNKKEGKYTCELTLSEHKDYVTSIMQMSDGKLVTASKDKTICIWEQNNRFFKKKHTLVEHDDAVYSVVEISCGRIASASDDNTIRIWEEIDSKFKCIQILQGHKKGVRALCFLKDGRLASGSEDTTVKLWKYDKEKWECVVTLTDNSTGITKIIQLQDGRIVTASRGGTVRVFDTSKATVKKEELKEHKGGVYSIVELPDGRLASASKDSQVILWKGGNMVE